MKGGKVFIILYNIDFIKSYMYIYFNKPLGLSKEIKGFFN